MTGRGDGDYQRKKISINVALRYSHNHTSHRMSVLNPNPELISAIVDSEVRNFVTAL